MVRMNLLPGQVANFLWSAMYYSLGKFRGLTIAAVLVVSVIAFAQDASPADGNAYQAHALDGIETLQGWYTPSSGLYSTTGWWNSANSITVLDDYMKLTRSHKYRPILANTFKSAQKKSPHFINNFYDDEGWWALAWIEAYDVTGKARYLSMAEVIFKDMAGGWTDDVCGGGIWWSKDRAYKNAIANELFLSVAAHLATRVKGAGKKSEYLSWAQRDWKWFQASGMINEQGLINDGLDSKKPTACMSNGKKTWTYNQGVVLGGLAELSKIDHDPALLSSANRIAGAAIDRLSDRNGVLYEGCESHCGDDAVQFKGIFLRNLAELNESSANSNYKAFAEKNATSIWSNAQGTPHQFGEAWAGPFDKAGAGAQTSALDALIAAAQMNRPPVIK